MARKVSRRGVRFVARWEGFRSCPYTDAAGVWTIGYGETEGVSASTPCISRRKARKQLRRRLNRDYLPYALRVLENCPRVRQREIDALASFAYNLGPQALATSTMAKRLQSQEGRTRHGRKRIYREELPKWVHAGGQRLEGLIKRRAAEVALAVRGDYSGRP